MQLLKQVKVLVVDDQPEYFSQLSESAELCSHQVNVECRYADSPEQIAELMQAWHPSVVILDAHSTSVACFDFLANCRQHAIPVVVTSTNHSPEIEKSAAAYGAIGYIAKSDDPELVEQFVHSLASISFAHTDLN